MRDSHQIDSLYSQNLVSRYQRISLILSILVGAIGLIGLLGWIFDIKIFLTIFPNFMPIRVNAAVAFMIISISLMLQQKKPEKIFNVRTIIAKILALIVFTIGLLTLLESLLGINFLIDQLLFKDTSIAATIYIPGRMSPITSITIFLIGLALLLLDIFPLVIHQVLSLLIALLAYFAMTGIAYHLNITGKMVTIAYIALPAAINMIFTSIAILFIRPTQGLMQLLNNDSSSGRMIRFLLPMILLVPLILGTVELLGENLGFWESETGTALNMTLSVVIFIIVTYVISYRLMKIDIKRKNIEIRLKATLAKLESSNNELKQFAYAASHDLQEPLRLIISFTQLLKKKYQDKLDANAQEYINFATEGANRMHILLDDLLIYLGVLMAKKHLTLVDSNNALQKSILELENDIKARNAEITFDLLPTIKANESQLQLIFKNLISNGIKFCQQKPKIHISAKTNTNEVVFSVQDNGIGIAKKYHQIIFTPFKRLHGRDKYSGTGIGLPICKKIIENYGGRIWVKSESNKGSTFYFSIPK